MNCRVHAELETDQSLSFDLRVENPNQTLSLTNADNVRFAPRRRPQTEPRFRLEVLDKEGRDTETVRLGDTGILSISLHEKGEDYLRTQADLLVSNVWAHDASSSSSTSLELIDSHGSVSPSSHVIDASSREVLSMDCGVPLRPSSSSLSTSRASPSRQKSFTRPSSRAAPLPVSRPATDPSGRTPQRGRSP